MATSHSSPSDQPRVVATGLLVLLAVLFLVTAWTRITAPFGDSDEGINGAVWGANSQGLRELGIIESRAGGIRVDRSKYATHPPLIVVETAAIEAVVGQHPWSTRAAAWVGSLAAIVLLFLVLRSLGIDPVVAAAATFAAMASHMLFVYGTMLDTMVTAFPFALAVVYVWHRQWTGERDAHPLLVLALASLACVGGWQATFLVGLCAVSTAARVRSERRAIFRALPYAAGVVIGVGLTLAWSWWVYGGFDVLNDKLLRRSGGTNPVSPGDMVAFQIPWLSQLLGVGFLAWIACAISLRDRRFRPLAALSLTSVIVYALLLREGSGGHQYWNYWGLFPAAVGIAYVFDLVMTGLPIPKRGLAVVLVPALLAIAIAAVNLTRPNQAAEQISAGYVPYELVERTPLPPGQDRIHYVAEPYRIDDWLRYRGGPPGQPLLNADDLARLAAEHPDDLVLVLGSCALPDPTGICEQLTFARVGPVHPDTLAPRFETAAELQKLLDG